MSEAARILPRPHRLHVQAFLHKHGGAIHLLGLEGFLFEGTTAKLLRYVLEAAGRLADMRFVVLDLGMVQGVDPSACALLGRLHRQLYQRDIRLVFANLQPSLVPMCMQHAALKDGESSQVSPCAVHAVPCAAHGLVVVP
jgi:anti-anti-sigma regulatory factor